MEHDGHDGEARGFFSSRANIVLLGFLGIGGYFLVTEHWARVVLFLPWLLLAACPLRTSLCTAAMVPMGATMIGAQARRAAVRSSRINTELALSLEGRHA